MDYRTRWELKDYLLGRTLERRILLFHVLLAVLFLGFLLNFWYLQGVQGDDYARLAETNRLRRIGMPPTRGVIFDRRREVIASTRPSLNLMVRRERAFDLESQLRRLAPILDLDYEVLARRIEVTRDRPLYEPLLLVEDLSLGHLAPIEARRELFPSIEIRQTSRRAYPHHDLFGHVLGYVGEVGEARLASQSSLRLGDIVGKTGIERAYDDRLRGSRGWNLVTVNSLGRRTGDAWVGRLPNHGQPLRMTLDLRVQRALREALEDEVGSGVFLDPRNGEILALVSTPSFDPNLFANGISRGTWESITADPRRPLHDRAIASFYAPGSTFKVVMAIAGLEAQAVTTEETFFCNGATNIHGRRRLCWKRGGHGWVNLRSALAHSCNVYFYHLGQRLGIDAIHEYGSRFHLGRPTGIDLPGEASGILPSPAWKKAHLDDPWYPGDTISVAIGQGFLAVTPIQMATMIAAVGADGRVPPPHLLRGQTGAFEKIHVSPATLDIVRRALREAVADGTGKEADLDDVAVAGKTGTAQVYRHSAGVSPDSLPKHERDHGWFVGYAPADDPRIAFAVVVEHGGHGGSSAAPVVKKALEAFFRDEVESGPEVAKGGGGEAYARTAAAR